MNNETVLHEHATGIHEAGHEEHEHHHETFITKYVFSQDHKMIAKQFLITGMIWAIIGGLFSVIFRLQLGYPESTFPWLEDFLGHWAKGGKLDPEFYYALVTMHGTMGAGICNRRTFTRPGEIHVCLFYILDLFVVLTIHAYMVQ
jgi:cytochrome c oxidase subunit 1